MARDSAIYIVDVYVPNEGEVESALEFAIIRINSPFERPTVYVHTFIQPPVSMINRIRWNDAHEHGISRDLFNEDLWPSIYDLITAEYLKEKDVVCFSAVNEPMLSLLRNCHSCFNILSRWQEAFAGDDEFNSLTDYRQMLSAIGLPSEDPSNTRYTPLMKRLHAYIAIWLYLVKKRAHNMSPEEAMSLQETNFWPIKSVPDPWYTGEPKELSDIPTEAICEYFSDRLPDFIDWSNMFIYRHDWKFGSDQLRMVKLSEQDSMLNFIFYNFFNLKTRLLVLAFYAIYIGRTEYARTIALHQGTFSSLQNSIKEDFATFVIPHLDDFLSADQKRRLIEALVKELIRTKSQSHNEGYDFMELKKHKEENGLTFKEEHIASNRNVVCYREILNKDEVLYRCFMIQGNTDERNECIDFIQEKINALLLEAKNPLSQCWLSESLKTWIEYITGFTWHELARDPRQRDSTTLTRTRHSIREIIKENSNIYFKSYYNNFRKCIEAINDVDDGQTKILAFLFQGIPHEFVVDRSDDNAGFFRRLINRF